MTFLALVPSLYTNVKQYNAKGDGSTDDTSAIAAALSSLSSTGGTLFFPPGVYISGNQPLLPNVNIVGAGLGSTTIRLKAGANTDLFSAQTASINLSAVFNAGSAGTLLNFTISDLTLDGNKANQSSGTSYPLRFYGYNFILRDIQVMNGYTGGILIDWNGGLELSSPSDDMESLIDSIKIHDCNGIGLQMGGPHDSKLRDVISFINGSHNFHFAPNAVGILALNCHAYNPPNTTGVCSYLIEANGCNFTNCVAEGSYYTNVAMIAASCTWINGSIFGTSPNWTSSYGIQLGQLSGQTPFPGQINQSGGTTTAIVAQFCMIMTSIQNNQAGCLNCANEQFNTIICNILLSSGNALKSGTINTGKDTFILQVTGLTADGTRNTTNSFNVCSNASSYPLTVCDATNGQVFQVDQYGNMFLNGGFNTSAGLYFTASSTAGALASSGTISLRGLPNIVVAPTANVNGVILQAGYAGQICVVANASAFSIQFAASGTSNVANGTSEVIPPNSMRFYWYDGTNSLWYGITSVGEQSATAVVIAASGQIATAGLSVSRVAPSAARASITMQAGTYAGQQVTVINESAAANTLTFNTTSATANVADSATEANIPGLTARTFVWDTSTSLWYRCN